MRPDATNTNCRQAKYASGNQAHLSVAIILIALLGFLFSASSASAAAPSWQLSLSSAPARLQPGPCEGAAKPQVLPQCGQVVVRADDLGDLPVSGSNVPVSITDVLPAGVIAKAIARTYTSSGNVGSENKGHGSMACSSLPATSVTCTWSEPSAPPLPPYELLEVAIEVEVAASAKSSSESGGRDNEVSISGGEGDACVRTGAGRFTSSACLSNEEGGGEYELQPTGEPVAGASLQRPLTIGGVTGFGVEEYTFENENEGGSLDTQAGSHPFQQTTNIAFNQGTPEGAAESYEAKPPALPKDLHFLWPPGLIGNTLALPQCTETQFAKLINGGANECPADTAVGVASVTVILAHLGTGVRTEEVPVFNLVPGPGEPARFGFEVEKATVIINPSVRTGSDYGITVSVENTTQFVIFVSSRVTVWGVPGDPVHDSSRGWGCMQEGHVSHGVVPLCKPEGQTSPLPFLTLPTSCPTNAAGEPVPLQTSLEYDSWQEPHNVLKTGPSEAMPALDGCDELPFAASLEVSPDVQSASSSTGLTVKVHVPQEASLNAEGLAGSDVRDTTVALPEGVVTNPAGGNGLEGCTGNPGALPGGAGALAAGALGSPGDQIGYRGEEEVETSPGETIRAFTPRKPGSFGLEGEEATLEQGVNFCPDASKIATVKISVPVLAHPLEGAVYLASQNANPFGSLLAMYIVAEDPISGVLVKLPGEVKLNPVTGQLVTTFENTPQAPFENLELNFFGGERAPLSTPSHCGTYTTQASFTPWSAPPGGNSSSAVGASTSFNITSGPHGTPCPGASLPFAPSLHSSSSNVNAGAFSDLSTTIGREDGNQDLQQVTLHYPPGLSGLLSGVELCPEAQANAGLCAANSQIGETIVSAGVGTDPVSVTGGKVYITEKYHGAPFGLSIVNPVKAGPFDLEHDTSNPNQDPACDCVVVRAKIEINPLTAALTVTTNQPSEGYAIPSIIDGIPVQIQHVNVNINRPGFTFNPTNCNKMEVTGAIDSDEGASAALTDPFSVTNCAALKFTPKFTVSTSGKTSKANGADLVTKVTEPSEPQGSQANITKVKVELPLQLPSRLTTLQKACLAKVFEANPAACPPASFIGHAVVHTPLLPVPLEGPAIFVSHGGEAFPSLTMVLQGYGVTIDLVGATFISKTGITSTTFKTVPDQPFSSFELTLPEGPYSALAANGNLCAPTTTKTVKKKVTVKVKGRKKTETRKVKEAVAGTLQMPNEFVGQNGAVIRQTTAIGVTGCARSVPAKKIKQHKGKKARK
jgi:hypothetical protein